MPLSDNISEDGVYTHVVADISRPSDVAQDGRGGVTQDTYNRLRIGVGVEFAARLHMAQVDPVLFDHPLLIDAMELQLAARILRRLRTYQEVADSLFADANIKWRLFLEAVAQTTEDGNAIDLVNIVEDGHRPQREPWTADPNELVSGFYPKSRR